MCVVYAIVISDICTCGITRLAIYNGFAHMVRQGGIIIMCVWRDNVGVYFIIAHATRQGAMSGMTCDGLGALSLIIFLW